MNNKILLIVFAALLGIYLLSRSCSGQKDRSFDPQLVAIDSASVDKIILNTSGDAFEDVTIEKQGNGWNISKGSLTVEAVPRVVASLLTEISDIKAKRIATRNPEKWKDYEVHEGAGNRIRAYSGNKSLTDFKVGKFVPNPQTRQFTTYIKKADDDAVYAFDGYLSVGLGQGFDGFRNNSLLDFEPADITGIEMAGQQFSLVNGKWSNSEGWGADSSKVASYLNSLKSLRGTDFADDFNPQSAAVISTRELVMRGNNLLDPIRVTAVEVPDSTKPFIVNSSLNENTYFKSDSSGVVSKLFAAFEDWKE